MTEHGDQKWWRSLEEYGETNIARSPQTEFPYGAFPETLDRRQMLTALAAATLTLPACGKAPEHIIPYVALPEGLTPGKPLTFASSLLLSGILQPVLAVSHEGRPTKLEGNPQHPASLGRTDAFTQAAIFSLYDPSRSKSILHEGQIASWPDFLSAITRS